MINKARIRPSGMQKSGFMARRLAQRLVVALRRFGFNTIPVVPAEPGGRDRIKPTVLTLLVLIQAAQIVVAGDQPSPQMFILRSHHHADPSPIPFDLFERLEQQLATAERVLMLKSSTTKPVTRCG